VPFDAIKIVHDNGISYEHALDRSMHVILIYYTVCQYYVDRLGKRALLFQAITLVCV